ncbi:MAG: hypothetical protein ABI867_05450 [Kofleriaceae bacterium]
MHSTTLVAVALIACSSSAADTPTGDLPGARFERDMMARYHMHQNFDLGRGIERLLIRGKLDDAKRFADSIGGAEDDPKHGPYAAQMVRVRERAVELAHASDLDDAIRKVAKLGAACGNCHGELKVGPAFESFPSVPVDKHTLASRMQRHRWAVDRLWEGVVGNADKTWRAGLDVLASQAFEEPVERGAHGRKLQQLAIKARKPNAGPLADRATTYGEILIECAGCHTGR